MTLNTINMSYAIACSQSWKMSNRGRIRCRVNATRAVALNKTQPLKKIREAA